MTVTIGGALWESYLNHSLGLPKDKARPQDWFDGPATELVQKIIEEHLAHAAQQFSLVMHREVIGELQAIYKVICELKVDPPLTLQDGKKRVGFAAGANAARTEMANSVLEYGESLKPRAVKMQAERVGPRKSEGGIYLG